MRWRRTAVPAATTVTALVVAVVSVVLGRADGVVIAVVLLVAAVLALRRPDEHASVRVSVHAADDAAEGAESEDAAVDASSDEPATGRQRDHARVDVRVEADTGVALVLVRVTSLGFETQRFALAPPAVLHARVPLAHSGEQELVSVAARGVATDAAFVSDATPQASHRAVVEPVLAPVVSLPVPSRLRGLTGAHASGRPGDGGEFRDIHPFAPGDRLRRIDWKATARLARRPGDLFVRRTNATSDLDVAIVLDDADDVGESVADWASGDPTISGVTSMDVARSAAFSLASAYLEQGDAVSFQVLSRTGGAVPRGTGGRHRERLGAAIARTSPHSRLLSRARTPLVAAGAQVLLLSTLLDAEPVRLAGLWRAAGHRVLVVDTLPVPNPGGLDRRQRLALRVVLALREERMHELRAVGADVVRWHGDAAALAHYRRRIEQRQRRRHRGRIGVVAFIDQRERPVRVAQSVAPPPPRLRRKAA